MKHILIITIAAVLLAGCGEVQQSADPVAHQSDPISEVDSALLDAAKEGNIEAVKQHLANGADVNAKDDGWTPLHNAAGYSTKEMVELLISNGADVNAKGEDGWTPLNITHDPETIDLLRKHGGKTKNELEAEAKK